MPSIFDENSIFNQNKVYEVPEGTTILKEGEVNLDMYKIVSGNVEMYTGYGTDKEILIGILGKGACFGEFGVLAGKPAIYTIITYSKVKLIRVSEALMCDYIREDPEGILQLMKNMAGTMMRMQHLIHQLTEEAKGPKYNKETLQKLIKENLREYAVYHNNTDDSKGMKGKMHFLNK